MAKWTAGIAAAALLLAAGTAQAAPFDARKPADVAAALKGTGTAGALKTDENGKLFFEGRRDDFTYSVEFRDCDGGNTVCNAAYYMASWDMEAPPASTLNLWNDVTWFCVAFEGSNGDPFLKMGFRPKASDTRAGLLEDHEKWLLCVDEFKSMLADPEGFESSITIPASN